VSYDASYILALAAVIAVVLGMVVLTCTIRSWRLPLPGHCPRCGYDMGHAASEKCSECGAEPGRPRRGLVGRRSWRMLLVGVLMIAGGASVLAIRHQGWQDVTPTPALLVIAPFIESACDAPDWRGHVMREIARRVRADDVSDRQLGALLDRAARALADGRSTAQDEYYLALVASAARTGKLWELGRADEFITWVEGDIWFVRAPAVWPIGWEIPVMVSGRHEWSEHGAWVPMTVTARLDESPDPVPLREDPESDVRYVTVPAHLAAGPHDLHLEARTLVPTPWFPPDDRTAVGPPVTRTVGVHLRPLDEIIAPIVDERADAAVRHGVAWEWDRLHAHVRVRFPPAARPHLTDAIVRLEMLRGDEIVHSARAKLIWAADFGGLARFSCPASPADLQVTSIRVVVDRPAMMNNAWTRKPPARYWPGVVEFGVDPDDLPEEGETRRVPVHE
jgi:hypothetical protein